MDEPVYPQPVDERQEVAQSSTLSTLKIIGGVILASLGLSAVVLTGLILLLRSPEQTASPTSSPTAQQGGGLFGAISGSLDESPAPVQSSPKPSLPPIPASKTITGGTHAFQTFNNCGPAALSMALSYFDVTQSQQTLGRSLRPYQQSQGDNDDKSVTLQEVAMKAEEFDLLAYQRPAGTTAILEAFIAQDIPVVARTWLEPGDDIGHFRVIRGYNQQNKTLVQDDSLQGKDKIYSYDDFNELWEAFNYEFLVLVPKDKQAIAEQILGELANENTAWEKALALAKTELDSNPNDVYAQFNQSVALYKLGQYEESVRVYERVASRLPSRMLWYQLEPVLAYYKLEDYDEVLAISDKILQNQNRAYSELHYLKGQIFEKRGQTQTAQEAYSAATQYNQSSYWKVNLL